MVSPQWIVAVRHDLKRVAREVQDYPPGYAPSVTVYREEGRFPATQIQRKIGGGYRISPSGNRVPRIRWTEAVRQLGLTPANELRSATRREVIEDLRRVALRSGLPPQTMPSITVYRELGRCSPQHAMELILSGEEGGWRDAARWLGWEACSPTDWGSLTLTRVLNDYRDVADEMGRGPGELGPSRVQFDEWIEYSAQNGPRLLGGSWNDFVRRAGYEPRPLPENLER